MEKLKTYWAKARSSLWFRPAILTLVGVAGAWVVLGVDRWVSGHQTLQAVVRFGGDPASAREVLGAIAGGMITIAGVSFSIVVIALTLTSNQFAPRVLRNFTSDRVNQTTIGVFIGTFVYSVLVLGAIHGGEGSTPASVPAVGVVTAVVAAIASLGFFVFFIHHISTSIQVSTIARNVARETEAEIEALFSRDHAVTGPTRVRGAPLPVPDGWVARADDEGYVDRIDAAALVHAAKEADLALDLLVGPGDFVSLGSPLAAADPGPGDPDGDAVLGAVRRAVLLASQRTIDEDPGYGFRELVDIAIKAISPGINDPNTAVNCVDYLGSFLRRLADREWPAPEWLDEDGQVRVRTPSADFPDWLSFAFSEIRRYGASDLTIVLRVLDALGGVADATPRRDRRAAAWEEAARLLEAADRRLPDAADRAAVDARAALVAGALGADPGPWRLGSPE